MLAMDCISNKRAIIMTLLEKLKLFKEGMNDESCVLAGRFETTIDEIISTLESQEEKHQKCGNALFVLSNRIARQEKLLNDMKFLIEKSNFRRPTEHEWLAALDEEGKK